MPPYSVVIDSGIQEGQLNPLSRCRTGLSAHLLGRMPSGFRFPGFLAIKSLLAGGSRQGFYFCLHRAVRAGHWRSQSTTHLPNIRRSGRPERHHTAQFTGPKAPRTFWTTGTPISGARLIAEVRMRGPTVDFSIVTLRKPSFMHRARLRFPSAITRIAGSFGNRCGTELLVARLLRTTYGHLRIVG